MLKFSDTLRKAAFAGTMGAGLLAVSAVALAPQIASAQMMRSSAGFHGGAVRGPSTGFHRDFDRGFDDRGFRRDWDDRWGWGWGPGWGFGVGFYGYPYYGGYYPYGCDYYDYCPYTY